eukprot:COSAG05_NODE_306_length_11691_cov_14.764665_8_plen_272_part_00
MPNNKNYMSHTYRDERPREVREEQAQGRGAHSKYCVAPPYLKATQEELTGDVKFIFRCRVREEENLEGPRIACTDWDAICIQEAHERICLRTCPKCLKGQYSSLESLRRHYNEKKDECRTEVIASGRLHGGNLEHPKVKAAIRRLKDPYAANERAQYYQEHYRDPDERKRRRIAKKEQKEEEERRRIKMHNYKRWCDQVDQFARDVHQERRLELREYGRYLSAAEREAKRKQSPAEREEYRQLRIFRAEEKKRMDFEASIKAQCTQSSDSE